MIFQNSMNSIPTKGWWATFRSYLLMRFKPPNHPWSVFVLCPDQQYHRGRLQLRPLETRGALSVRPTAPLEGGPLEGGMIFVFHPFPRGWQRKSTLKILQDHSSGKCGFLEIGPKNHGLQMASLSHGRHLQMNLWESWGDLVAGRGDDRQSHMWRGRLWRQGCWICWMSAGHADRQWYRPGECFGTMEFYVSIQLGM